MKKILRQVIKSKKKFLILSLLLSLALIFSVSAVSAAQAGSDNATIPSDNLTVSDVETTSNSNNSLESKGNQTPSDPQIWRDGVPVPRGGHPAGYQYTTIAEAIADALSGDTIMLEDDATFYEHDLTIDKNLDFNVLGGGHATINAQGQGRIFYINSGMTVNIYNLILQNGNADQGGAIYVNAGGTLNIVGSTFTSNTANYGGVIRNNGVLNVTGSTFTSNRAFRNAGVIYNDGALNVVGSTFASNSAGTGLLGGLGGVIYNFGTLSIVGSTFTGNSITSKGGVIYNRGTLNVTGSTFTGNTANDGGVIYNFGTLNVTGSTFTGNAAAYGGVITNYGGEATVKFNRIVGNSFGIGEIYVNDGTVDATLNWWGSNTPTIIIFRYGGVVLFGPWIILTVITNPATITNGGDSTVTADLLHDSNGVYHDLALGHVPDIPVTLTVPWGSFTNHGTTHLVTLNTVNGAITPTIFYANEGVVNHLYNPVKVTALADGYTTDDTESAYITINRVVNISITKISPVTVIAGNQLTYTITITNSGLDPAEGVTLDDVITNEDAFRAGTLQYRFRINDDAWSDWFSFLGPLHLDLGTILNDKNAVIEIRGTVNSSTPKDTVITNTATANTTTTPCPKVATATTTVDTQANLVVSKTGPATVAAGNQLTYIITVTNNGPSDAQNVVIQDVVPAILQNVTHDSFSLGTIGAGQSKTVTITGTVPANTALGTVIENSATVTSDTSGTITSSDIVQTIVDTQSDVDLTKTVDKPRPNVGDTVTFTVTVHNYGPSDATNIQISDLMPSGFADVIITPSKGTYAGGVWILDLASGEEATLTLSGKVTPIMAGITTINTATKLSQTEQDLDTTDSASASIYVPKSDLYIKITSDKNNPKVGEMFTITYKLGNNGPDAADNVTITIPLPEGFEYTNIHGDGSWTYNAATRTITWTFKNVPVGDPYLYISGEFTKPGSCAFGSSISSETYNINTVTPVTVNAVSNVKATSKTMPMQKTGLPVNYLILAILMVIGGLLVPRK